MRASAPRLALALVVSALAPLTGCDDAKDPTEPAADTSVVSEAASLAAVAVSDGDRAARLVAGLLAGSVFAPIGSEGAPLDRDAGSSPPPQLGGIGPSAPVPVCPSAGEPSGGLDTACTVEAGALQFAFGGVVETERGPATVEGTLAAHPVSPMPNLALRYDVTLVATIAAPGGTATWNGGGTVDVDAVGAVGGLRLAVAHALGDGGSSSLVATSAAVDVLVPSRGETARFFVDRGTGAGTAQVSGATVARLSFAEGCLHLDWIDPGRADETVCPVR